MSSPDMPASQRVSLRDGEALTIRGIRQEDAPHLKEEFAQLSPSSRYFRFHTFIDELPDEWATRFINVDGRTQMALVAICREGNQERLVGVARYAVDPSGSPEQAEFAVTVQDGYQGRGLGTILFKRLAAFATDHGIRTFIAIVHGENRRMLQILHHSGYRTRLLGVSEGQLRLAIELVDNVAIKQTLAMQPA